MFQKLAWVVIGFERLWRSGLIELKAAPKPRDKKSHPRCNRRGIWHDSF